jgi:hypothetical protein
MPEFGRFNEAAHTFLDVVGLNEAVAASEKTGQAYCMLQWTHPYLGNRLQLDRRRRASSYTTKEVADWSGQFVFGDIRLTADIEAGYGSEPPDVAETIRQVIQAWAVGLDLEDNAHGRGSSHSSTASYRQNDSERRG